jgi:hypothetical protein
MRKLFPCDLERAFFFSKKGSEGKKRHKSVSELQNNHQGYPQ